MTTQKAIEAITDFRAMAHGHAVLAEALDMAIEALSAQPEIIRCKDCKFARMTYDGECKYCDIWFPDEKTYMDGDYFCASAERRTDG